MFAKSIAATGARASWASVGAIAVRRSSCGAGRTWCRRSRRWAGPGLQGLEPLAEPLDLLQDQLQLVLGPRDLAREPGDVGPPGDAQVAHHEVDRAGRDLRHAHDVLRHAHEQRAEAVARHEVLHGPGHLGLRLVVEALHLVGRTGSVLCHVHLATRGRGHSILATWPRNLPARSGRSSVASGSCRRCRCASSPSWSGSPIRTSRRSSEACASRPSGWSSRSRPRCARRRTRSTSRRASTSTSREAEGPSVPDAVKADPRLNAAQRRALLAVYQAFVEAPRRRRPAEPE